MVERAEILIVGAGPAAASAAVPLVEAGLRVTVLDGGTTETEGGVATAFPALVELRNAGISAWRRILSSDLRDLDAREFVSPRLRPVAPRLAAYNELNHIATHRFSSIGLLGTGGLSRIWGAGVSMFDSDDLAGFPIGLDDLLPSYHAVIGRIGVSGSRTDDMADFHGIDSGVTECLPPGPVAGALLARYRQRGGSNSFRLGRARLAVLSKDRAGRAGCRLSGACNLRCRSGAVYDAAFDFAALSQRPNFTLLDRFVVHRLRHGPDGWIVDGLDPVNGEARRIEGRVVVLAAGTIPSTRLAFEHLGLFGVARRLEVTPVHTAAFLIPALLGTALPNQAFAMTELSFRRSMEEISPHRNDYIFGSLFAAGTIPNPDLACRMPLTSPAARAVARTLLPALALAMIYLGGRYSNCTATLRPIGEGKPPILDIDGGLTPDFAAVSAATRRIVARSLRHYDAWLMPGSWGALPPGLDVHYGASLAMGDIADRDGRLPSSAPLYVVDGAALSRLPAKSLTLTIMANADRIARRIARG